MQAMRTALGAAAIVAAGVAAAGQQRFQAGIELVHLPVVVSARGGAPVRGLAAADFDVREDGRSEPLTFFAAGDAGDTVPLHLGVMLDTSESMEQDLGSAANAAVRIVKAMTTAVDVTFVDFDSQIRLGFFSSPTNPLLFERIRARHPQGTTALYDALALYLARTSEQSGEHVLLLYTDGGDTTSRVSFGDLERRLRASHVLVYALGYLANVRFGDQLMPRTHLTSIARDTGGEAYFPISATDVDRIDTRIIEELQSRYTLGYVSSNLRKDGAWRKVQVRLTRPDLKDAVIRTRPGYFGPG